MFGSSTKSSSASAGGSSASGIGSFNPINDVSFSSGLLSKPVHFLVLVGLAYVGYKAWVKFKK